MSLPHLTTDVQWSPFIADRDRVVRVNAFEEGISADHYLCLIDLDGAGYKHGSGTKVVAVGFYGKAIKSVIGSQWGVRVGTILRIDGTDADVGYLPAATISLRDTSQFSKEVSATLFPILVDLGVTAGDFDKITDGSKITGIMALNTGLTIKDVLGNDVTPAVGDVVIETELILGAGTLDYAYTADYWVE